MKGDKFLYWIDELNKEHNNLVGKKCAYLGELTAAGFQVPPGFALSLSAYEEFLTTTGAINDIKKQLSFFSADPDNPKDLPKYRDLAKTLSHILESKPVPKKIKDDVSRYYEALCQKVGLKNASVSTRSAGAASHPGQYETYLNVAGEKDVIDHIVKVWSSTFNMRSLVARSRAEVPLESDPIGVGVIRMVNAKAAGVMFTADPSTADTSKVLIEGVWGLGESVVSGSVTPDLWTVDVPSLEIIERKISPNPSPAGSVGNDAYDGQKGCLTDKEVIELTKTGKKIEKYFGSPQDIEWAIDSDRLDDNIVLLQTRPEKFRLEFNFGF